MDEARLSETSYRLLVTSVKDYAIFLTDPTGRVITWNEGAERMKQYRASEIVGRHLSTFYTPEDVAAGKVERLLAAAERDGRVEDEGWRVRRDGTRFWADVVITAVRDETGRLRGFAKVTRDLTERRRAEEARIKALEQALEIERLRELDQFKTNFLNTAAHELLTPLTPMRSILHVMSRKTGLEGEALRKHVDLLSRNLTRLNGLVNDLLDASRLEAAKLGLQKRTVDLGALVRDAVESFRPEAEQKGVRLTGDVKPGISLEADPARLTQVLYNLLSNALKFTPPGGRVAVETRQDESGSAILRVSDTGVGVAPDFLPRMFRPFSRAHLSADQMQPGTGLGLYITKGLVELHGGRIECASPGPDQGAVFTVVLPV